MREELSGVTIVLIIGGGVIVFVILFIFAKRQIMRFAIRSRRGPHFPIGHDAKKSFRKEIERQIEAIPKIVSEPKLLLDDSPYILQPGQPLSMYYYRFKAVDDVKLLEREISKQDKSLSRHPSESLRAYLLTSLAAPLNGTGQKLIQQFCDMYEHARHDPHDFGDEEYQAYHRLLLKLIEAAKLLKTSSNSRKSSPSRTPVKKQQEKVRSLLDPAKLNPAQAATFLNLALNEEDKMIVETSQPPLNLNVTAPDANDNETSV